MARELVPFEFSVCTGGDRVRGDQLIAWIHARLGSIFTGFDELGSGEAYCWLLCMLRPESLPLRSVRRGSKRELNCVHNFKLLQHALDKACLRREFRIEGLMAGRFRDHYKVLKWSQRSFDETPADRGADAAGGAREDEAAEYGQAAADYRRVVQATGCTLLGSAPPVPGPVAPAPLAVVRRHSTEPQDEGEKIEELVKERDKYLSALRCIENLCRGRETKISETASVVDKITELLKPLELQGPPAALLGKSPVGQAYRRGKQSTSSAAAATSTGAKRAHGRPGSYTTEALEAAEERKRRNPP
ncbi:hypothetical protein HPB48_007549 [Haemaphysalis longicornis]|uniref:Uncharacterized protein n=1 Tax=Haemaphysalis longicornis TaxID=44386 RepID=A0A9J6F6Y6_HAELO|nr:hypothetical protein HPB48_007549 [Haemaphysalis longicornis]